MKCFLPLLPVIVLLPSCAIFTSKEAKLEKAKQPGYLLNKELYAKADSAKTSLRISLWDQKAWLLNGKGDILLTTDVSTGSKDHDTPAANYKVLEKQEGKRSNLYGKLVNKKTREVVVEKSWLHEGSIPSDLEFEGTTMPYWMRLTWTGIGIHVGKFEKRTKSSFGCIRVYEKAQPYVFDKTKVGTKVTIVERSLVEQMNRKKHSKKQGL